MSASSEPIPSPSRSSSPSSSSSSSSPPAPHPAASAPFLLYGAYGYTGELLAREAVERGWSPILAGRREEPLAALAEELGRPYRVASLDDAESLGAALEGCAAVLHAAGPFEETARPMVDACLDAGVHYLDITGEAVVFEALARRDEEAREAGITVLPGVGFDVVPSDCLAAHVAACLREAHGRQAERLTLAFRALGQVSRGTATTMIRNLGRGGLVRRDGRLTRVPTAWKTRSFDFGTGERAAVTIPWGDVSTAWRSTGIPHIEVYMAAPLRMRLGMKAVRWLSPLLTLGPIQSWLEGRARSGEPGPDADQRRRGKSVLVALAEHGDHFAAARLTGPEGYTLTVLAGLEVLSRVLAGTAAPGYQTPATAFGPDLVLALPGVVREDLETPP